MGTGGSPRTVAADTGEVEQASTSKSMTAEISVPNFATGRPSHGSDYLGDYSFTIVDTCREICNRSTAKFDTVRQWQVARPNDPVCRFHGDRQEPSQVDDGFAAVSRSPGMFVPRGRTYRPVHRH